MCLFFSGFRNCCCTFLFHTHQLHANDDHAADDEEDPVECAKAQSFSRNIQCLRADNNGIERAKHQTDNEKHSKTAVFFKRNTNRTDNGYNAGNYTQTEHQKYREILKIQMQQK